MQTRPMMRSRRQQAGVTLLEVLVGFVIFTSALVAILDYVSNQIYLEHLIDDTHQKASLLSEVVALNNLDSRELSRVSERNRPLSIELESEVIDQTKVKQQSFDLVQTHYTIRDGDKHFDWAVLELK